MGIIAKVTFFFFVLGLLILSLDIDFVYDIFTKFEKFFIPKNKNDQKLRPFLFIFYIGCLAIAYNIIFIIYKIFNY
ncbi:TPA: hypothetical protein ACIOJV_001343 [Streptococcus agalactiae]